MIEAYIVLFHYVKLLLAQERHVPHSRARQTQPVNLDFAKLGERNWTEWNQVIDLSCSTTFMVYCYYKVNGVVHHSI